MDHSLSSNSINIDKFEPKMAESFITEANLKIMVPNGISGAIIGKQGATIAKIQQETSCEISISKTNEFFPTTKERVVLITGSVQGILNVISYMTDQIEERLDQRDRMDNKSVLRNNQIKIIVPDKLAKLIVGKQGEFVKLVQESAGVKMVMMSREDSLSNMDINERVLTLTSDVKLQLFSGAEMVILKMLQDPIMNSTIYTHMDYSADQGQPGRVFSGRDRSRSPISQYSSYYRDNSTVPRHYPQPASVPYGSSIRPASGTNQYNASESVSPLQLLQTFSSIRNTCRSRDYNQMVETEIMNAVEVMVKYNMLPLVSGAKHDAPSMARTPNHNVPFNAGYNANEAYEDVDFTANNFGATYMNTDPMVTDVTQDGRSCSMYIPDSVIGAIVGKQGANISEIQRYTDTTIDIEKRKPGEKFEGKDRFVEIKGESRGVQIARREIMRVVNEELRRLEKGKK